MASYGIRVLGIVSTAIVLIIGGLILLLGTTCAFNGYESQPPNFIAGLVWLLFLVLFILGCALTIVKLAKGISKDEFASLNLASQASPRQVPGHRISDSSIKNGGDPE